MCEVCGLRPWIRILVTEKESGGTFSLRVCIHCALHMIGVLP